MSNWVLILFTMVSVLVLLAGALNFPYVPMWLGVYGNTRDSFRGRLILKLLWLFPAVTFAGIYLSWASHSLYIFIPFVYLFLLWNIRANKVDSSGAARQYNTLQDNLKARLDELEFRWPTWLEIDSEKKYILYRFFAPDEASASILKQTLVANEKLHDDIEMNTYKNKTFSVYVSITLESMEKNALIVLTERMVNIAWANKSELLSLDVVED